ncbi:MAG: hypothetical protein K0R22_1443, partial [Sporomusa sp.]|nr:hypothetical protein [Sporomusa sp.]
QKNSFKLMADYSGNEVKAVFIRI